MLALASAPHSETISPTFLERTAVKKLDSVAELCRKVAEVDGWIFRVVRDADRVINASHSSTTAGSMERSGEGLGSLAHRLTGGRGGRGRGRGRRARRGSDIQAVVFEFVPVVDFIGLALALLRGGG